MRIGVIVGSVSSKSINRTVASHLAALAPEGVELVDIDLSKLPIYSPDYDADFPAVAREFKDAIASVDGVIIVTPEYSRSIPGVLKNALDWSARPWGQSSLSGKPVAIMGASVGPIGTAAAQQHLRAILGHLNAHTLGQPEVFLRFDPQDYAGDEVVNADVAAVLSNFLTAVAAHVERFALETVSA